MRAVQLIGTAGIHDFLIDPVTNKLFLTPPPHAFKSDSSMGSSQQRKADLLCPAIVTRLLEMHMIVITAVGTTSNPLAFKFNIVNFMTGVVTSTIPTLISPLNPVPMSVGVWTKIFDASYNNAPMIHPGHYLQMEFTGWGGAAGAGNNYSCQAYWRLMVAA